MRNRPGPQLKFDFFKMHLPLVNFKKEPFSNFYGTVPTTSFRIMVQYNSFEIFPLCKTDSNPTDFSSIIKRKTKSLKQEDVNFTKNRRTY